MCKELSFQFMYCVLPVKSNILQKAHTKIIKLHIICKLSAEEYFPAVFLQDFVLLYEAGKCQYFHQLKN